MAPTNRHLKRLRTATCSFKVYNVKGRSKYTKVKLNARGTVELQREGNLVDARTNNSSQFDEESLGPSSPGQIIEEDVNPSPRVGICDSASTTQRHSDSAKPESDHMRRKAREEAAWEKARDALQKAHVKEQFFPDRAICVECQEKTTKPKKAVCRCLDCGWEQYFCLDCAVATHSKRGMFHLLELWKDGTFQPMFLNSYVLSPPGHNDECGSIHDIHTIVFVDIQGRQHLKKVKFCKCQSDAEALVSMGFWPGSIDRPVIAFDMRLLELFRNLLFECHVSLDKLCDMLSLWKYPLLPTHVQYLYRTLNSCSFDEYRIFKDSMGIQEDNCVLCPMPGETGVLIEIMDACFGFVRKKSAGTSVNHPRYAMRMFADQEDVDNFVTKHSKQVKKSENPCSQYRAGEITDSIRSKGRNEKFDEKAVFGRICRHGHPKGFISLKHGERIAYAVYELKRMTESYKDSVDVELKCMYDIACILDTHLQGNTQYGLEDFTERIQFGIPIFHAYVHKAKCQVDYSPRRNAGFGLTDGEGIERLWSYLRKFSYMTKEMQPSRRTDILSEALLHYAKRMLRNQGKHLTRSLKKAEALKQKSALELENCVDSVPAMRGKEIPSIVLQEWKEEELIVVKKKTPPVAAHAWKEQYAILLWTQFLLRNSIATSSVEDTIDDQGSTKAMLSKIKTLDEKLKSIEKIRNVKNRWKLTDESFTLAITAAEVIKYENVVERLHAMAVERHLQLMLKERYSRGQKQAVRLARRCTKQTKRIKAEIMKYNAHITSLKEHVQLPIKQLMFDEVKDLKSTLYDKIESSRLLAASAIPFSVKKRILELTELEERCTEEKSLLHSECERLFNWQLKLASRLKSESLSLSEKNDSFSLGLSSILKAHSLVIEKEIIENKPTYNLFNVEVPETLSEYECHYTAQVRCIMNHISTYDESDDCITSSESDTDDDDDPLTL